MNMLNNKGFTLIELIATIVVLALVMGIGSYAITGLIQKTKDRNYELFIQDVNDAVESYYLECKYINNDCLEQMTLGYLVRYGFLKGNSINDDMGLVNPLDNNEISNCNIRYRYNNGNILVEAVNPSGSCPTSY